MGVWQGVAMDFLKFHPGLPYLTFLRPAGGPTPETALRLFQGWPARRSIHLQPSRSPLVTPRRMPVGGSDQSKTKKDWESLSGKKRRG
jgi:hypothetical protein